MHFVDLPGKSWEREMAFDGIPNDADLPHTQISGGGGRTLILHVLTTNLSPFDVAGGFLLRSPISVAFSLKRAIVIEEEKRGKNASVACC